MPCSDIPEYDLEIYQGDDRTLAFRWKAGDPAEAVNLTDYTITLECSDAALTKVANITSAVDGEFEFVYVPADTASTLSRRVRYECVFIDAFGTKVTKFRGTLSITPEVVA